MLNKTLMGILTAAIFFAGPALARTPAPEGAQVYIISPAHGEVVSSPVMVKFGLRGMGVAPAGLTNPRPDITTCLLMLRIIPHWISHYLPMRITSILVADRQKPPSSFHLAVTPYN